MSRDSEGSSGLQGLYVEHRCVRLGLRLHIHGGGFVFAPSSFVGTLSILVSAYDDRALTSVLILYKHISYGIYNNLAR